MNSLPKIATRQRRDCDLNPGPSAPESSMLTTRLSSHPGERRNIYSYSYSFNNSCQTAGVKQSKTICTVGLEIYKLISILIQNSKDKITVVNRVIRQES